MSNYITTYTRKHFDPVNPEPVDMDIKDIAHALSMICRGNGHVSSFWSVGEEVHMQTRYFGRILH